MHGDGVAPMGAHEATRQHDEKNTLPFSQNTSHPIQTNASDRTSTAPVEAVGSSHHYEKDAALAGGAGATGLGAYEAKKHNDEKQRDTSSQTAGTQSGTLGSSQLRQDNPHYETDGAIGTGSAIAATSTLGHEWDAEKRPDTLSAPGSRGDMASNASIKSGVIGKTPSGSSMTQAPHSEDTPLPKIPATGGRFMEEGLTSQPQR
jgi:hypothetical protein